MLNLAGRFGAGRRDLGWFLADYPHPESGPADAALAQMRAALRSPRRNRAVAQVWDKAARISAPPHR